MDEGLQIFIRTTIPEPDLVKRQTIHVQKKPIVSTELLTPPLDSPPPRSASMHQKHKKKAVYHMKTARVSYM